MITLVGQILGIRGNYESDKKKMLMQITKSRKKHHCLSSVRFEIITFISSFISYSKPLDRKIKPGSRGKKKSNAQLQSHYAYENTTRILRPYGNVIV